MEELCSDSKLTIAINAKGHICSLGKDGYGGISPSLLTEMMMNAQELGMRLIKQHKVQLEEDFHRPKEQQFLGYLA